MKKADIYITTESGGWGFKIPTDGKIEIDTSGVFKDIYLEGLEDGIKMCHAAFSNNQEIEFIKKIQKEYEERHNPKTRKTHR